MIQHDFPDNIQGDGHPPQWRQRQSAYGQGRSWLSQSSTILSTIYVHLTSIIQQMSLLNKN